MNKNTQNQKEIQFQSLTTKIVINAMKVLEFSIMN